MKTLKIIKQFNVPTGYILVVQGERGLLEVVSLGDYGKGVNIKADFLDLSRTPSPVRHTDLLPLEKKWVITTSSQYGCTEGCLFCDAKKAGSGKNCSTADIVNQLLAGLAMHPEVTWTDRLNHHHARMGEPSWNFATISASTVIRDLIHDYLDPVETYHPVISTMLPKYNINLEAFLEMWCFFKNDVQKGEAGLQLSINSTNEDERKYMFANRAHRLRDIGQIMEKIDQRPNGRKYTLNFAVADWEIDPDKLLRWFDPRDYIIKLTPMHKTNEAVSHGIETYGDYTQYYSYQEYEEALVDAGYDVLVFIASEAEDLGRITCGNAILGGSVIETEHEIIHNPRVTPAHWNK